MAEYHGITVETEKGTHTVFPELCKGCGLCIAKCPKKTLTWADYLGAYGTPSVRVTNGCNACGTCQMVCPDCAIVVVRRAKAG